MRNSISEFDMTIVLPLPLSSSPLLIAPYPLPPPPFSSSLPPSSLQASFERWAYLIARRKLHKTSHLFKVSNTLTHPQQPLVAMATQQEQTVSQWSGQDPLREEDPEIMDLIGREKQRQRLGLELIASEVSCILYYTD